MEGSYNPIQLLCPKCGAPTHYRIADRVYHCSYCGSETPPFERFRKTEEWRKIRIEKLRREAATAGTVLYSCPGCGARVIVKEGEALAGCSFCGSSLVRRSYTEKEPLPAGIIPFKITREEAVNALKDFAVSGAGLREKVLVERHLNDLQGYYLPYQFVRGPLNCRIARDSGRRFYNASGYAEDIAVNVSRQLKNEVLDRTEPFDWSEFRDFHFGYVAGHRVKIQDLTDEELLKRVKTEVENDCLPVVEKTMRTKGVSLDVSAPELEQLPVLLPMYIIAGKDLSAAVNGQTGAVAVSLNKQENTNRFWFVEPLLTTLVLSAAMFLFSRSPALALYTAAAVAAVAFVAFGQDREAHYRLKVSSSLPAGEKGGKTAEPVFWETVKGKAVPVDISFYTPLRVLKYVILLPLFNALPLLLAMFFQWSRNAPLSELHYSYISIWLVISIPMTFIYWIAYLRRDIFDQPVVRLHSSDGKGKRVRPDRSSGPESFLEKVKYAFGFIRLSSISYALLLFGFPLLMFVMSVYLILTG